MEIVKITTKSGSVYLVDEEKKLIKRQSSNNDTVRAIDEWKQYSNVVITLGKQMAIIWTKDVPLLDENVGKDLHMLPATVTSPIISIEKINV